MNIDHPQPLLPMRRGDASSRDDAFSRAIIAETDPFARGYMENLRAQIATIAARHGANARDVWDRAVQDRMSVDELDAVNDLFKRIKAMAERKISRGEERRLLESMNERVRTAQTMLAEALKIPGISAVEVIKYFARAKLFDSAADLLTITGEHPGYLTAKVALAEALEFRAENPKRARELLRTAHEDAQRASGKFLWKERFVLSAYDALLRELSDQELGKQQLLLRNVRRPFVPLEFVRLELEYRRRGLQDLFDPTGALRAFAHGVLLDEIGTRNRSELELLLAEMSHAFGVDPQQQLRRLFGDDSSDFSELIFTAAKVGALDVIEDFRLDISVSRPDLRIDLIRAKGRIAAGDLEGAERILRAETFDGEELEGQVLRELCVAFLEADRIDRAEALYATLDSKDAIGSFRTARSVRADTTLQFMAARARRGDDILAEASATGETYLPPALRQNNVGLNVANAAIATIGYTVGMRKRIAEYAGKR